MFRGATLPAQPRGDDTGHVAVAGLFVNGSSQPDAEPHPLAPATHMTASMAPVTTANPSPAAAPPPLSNNPAGIGHLYSVFPQPATIP